MNKQRRKELGEIWDRLNAMKTRWEKLQNDLSGIKDELDAVRDAEQEALDALPENQQNGERGETMAEYVSALTTAADGIGDLAEADAPFEEWLDHIDNTRVGG
jgi:archaellum component FlaC